MVTSTLPAVPIKETEKSQQHQSSQGTPPIERTGAGNGAAQPTRDPDLELSSSTGDDGICGKTCQQVLVSDGLPHNDGGFMAWICGTYRVGRGNVTDQMQADLELLAVLGTHLVVMNTW